MQDQNNLSTKIRLYGNIIVPSALSLTLSLVIALLTLFIYHLRVFLNFFDTNVHIGIGSNIVRHLDKGLSQLVGNSRVGDVVLLIFWASVGLIIYAVSRALVKGFGEVSTEVAQRNKFLWPRNSHPNLFHTFLEHFLFGLAILLILFFYCAHVLSFFLRGKILILGFLGTHPTEWLQAHSVVNQVIFVVTEIVALQVVVILLRLLFMRNRLFS